MLAEIHGYFLGGTNNGDPGTFVSTSPHRFLDTRIGVGAPKGRVAAHSWIHVKIAGANGIPTGIGAAVANVTAVQAGAIGFISVLPGTAKPGDPVPLTSTVNFQPKQNRANVMLVEIAADGTISLYNGSTRDIDLVVDVTGYFVAGDPIADDGAFVSSTPFRVFDSRGQGGRPAGALTTSKICAFGIDDTLACAPGDFSLFKAVVVNVTAAHPQAAGFLATWDGLTSLPSVSSSNFSPGQDVAGSVVVPMNPDGTISIYNGSYGNVDLVVDVTGFFLNVPVENTTSSTGKAQADKTTSERIAKALKAMLQPDRVPAAVAMATTR